MRFHGAVLSLGFLLLPAGAFAGASESVESAKRRAAFERADLGWVKVFCCGRALELMDEDLKRLEEADAKFQDALAARVAPDDLEYLAHRVEQQGVAFASVANEVRRVADHTRMTVALFGGILLVVGAAAGFLVRRWRRGRSVHVAT